MYTLQNDNLKVCIDKVGAELKSLCSQKTGIEYMWQPGYDIWDHSSMILFPNPGRICRDRTIINGKAFPATMHGFAYRSMFDVVEETQNQICFELRANEETQRYFPYDFRLRVCFCLQSDKLVQKFQIFSCGKEPMYFSLGAHPGFYLPIVLGESGEDYKLRFDCPQNLDQLELQQGTSLLTERKTPYLRNETDIKLSEDFFNGGPILLGGVDAHTITLFSEKTGHFVELGIDGFPYLCLWGNPHKNAMICMEPWCGVSDLTNTKHIWEEKLGIECVQPGEIFTRTVTFRVG